jgi:hypothetical protein
MHSPETADALLGERLAKLATDLATSILREQTLSRPPPIPPGPLGDNVPHDPRSSVRVLTVSK